MQSLILFIAVLGTSSFNLISGEYIPGWYIYTDLRFLNATCPPYDTCYIARTLDSLEFFSCECTAACVQRGTCCRNSLHQSIKPSQTKPACRPVNNKRAYFMVDKCPPGQESVWENLCQAEGGTEDDALKFIPVTSLYSLITYKNYFCFRCHETTDDFLYWNVVLGSYDREFDLSIDKNEVSVSYDYTNETWVAPLGTGGTTVPVVLHIKVPDEIETLPVFCDWDVISKCADNWNDKEESDKCEAYMGIVYIKKNDTFLKYRNAHCAICNNEDLRDMSCKSDTTPVGWIGGAKKPFSFTHLFDVNTSDGEKVGKIQKCEEDSVWDPYGKRCRKLTCALPEHVVQDGKCTLSRLIPNS